MIKKCSICGKKFETHNSQKYCSKECYRIAMNAKNREERKKNKKPPEVHLKKCPICGKEFETIWVKQKYCSPECKHESKKEINRRQYCKNREKRIADAKEYREKNKEEIKVKSKIYREKNKEHISERNKEYYQDNKEEKKAKRRAYVAENREEVNRKQRENYHANIEENRKKKREDYQKHKEDYRVYNATHKEERNARRRNKRETDPEYKMKDWCRGTVRRCISSKSKKTFSILGYTPLQLREHIESQLEEGWTWANYGEVWNIDHIKPLSAFTFIKEDETIDYDMVREANALINLKPMSASANFSKSGRWTSEDEQNYQQRKNSKSSNPSNLNKSTNSFNSSNPPKNKTLDN